MRLHCAFLLLAFCSLTRAQAPSSIKPDFSAIRRDLLIHVGKDDVPGLAVAVSRNGITIWEEGFGWADREAQIHASAAAPFYIASITKTITATALLHLVEQGKLQLDEPINQYLGAAKVHSTMWDASKVTVRRLATHTGGLTTFTQWCSTASDPRCDIDNEIARYGVLVSPPGEAFDYSNLDYGILGKLVARVSSQSLDSYLHQVVFRPLGMSSCGITVNGPVAAQYDQNTHARSASRVSGHEGASGLHCSARDLLSFGMFHLKERAAVKSLLNERDIQEMQEAQPATQGQYGLGWWIGHEGDIETISAQGGTSDAYALLELVPAKNIAIVVVANSYSKLVSGLERRILSLLATVPPEEPSGSESSQVSSTSAWLAGKWAGQILTYQGPIRVKLDIAENGRIGAEIAGKTSSPIVNIFLQPKYVYGQLRAEPGLPDSFGGPFIIELSLSLRGDRLVGGATFNSLPEHGDSDQHPHFISLTRDHS